MLTQIAASPNNLEHGHDARVTTGFTSRLGNLANSWKLTGLYGCTFVIIMSRRRMYMTHIWEVPTMIMNYRVRTDVIPILRNSIAGHLPGLPTLTGPGRDFDDTEDNPVRAFIITNLNRNTDNPSPSDLDFPRSVVTIEAELVALLGTGQARPVAIPYKDRVEAAPEAKGKNPYGKVLVLYDPVAAWFRSADGTCVRQIAGVVLWFEDHPAPLHSDLWADSGFQGVGADDVAGRVGFGDGEEVRLVWGRNVTDEDEGKWRRYEGLMGGGSCDLPSKIVSASRVSSTLRTSPMSIRPSASTSLETSAISSSPSSTSSTSTMPIPSTFRTSIATTTSNTASTSRSIPVFTYTSFSRSIPVFTYHPLPSTSIPQSQSTKSS